MRVFLTVVNTWHALEYRVLRTGMAVLRVMTSLTGTHSLRIGVFVRMVLVASRCIGEAVWHEGTEG